MDKGEGRGGGAIKTAFDTSDEYQPDEHNGRPLTLEYQPEGKTIIIDCEAQNRKGTEGDLQITIFSGFNNFSNKLFYVNFPDNKIKEIFLDFPDKKPRKLF